MKVPMRMNNMTENTNNETTSDERLMSAVAHFFGLLPALIIWALQKDKSEFIRFQSVQALAFDFAVAILGGVISTCLLGVLFLGIAGSIFAVPNNPSPENIAPIFVILPTMFPFGIFICILPYSLLLLIARSVAAAAVINGRHYRYPILGNWVENFLSDHSQDSIKSGR